MLHFINIYFQMLTMLMLIADSKVITTSPARTSLPGRLMLKVDYPFLRLTALLWFDPLAKSFRKIID